MRGIAAAGQERDLAAGGYLPAPAQLAPARDAARVSHRRLVSALVRRRRFEAEQLAEIRGGGEHVRSAAQQPRGLLLVRLRQQRRLLLLVQLVNAAAIVGGEESG